MAARAYWQGQIRLALVSIPVEVYPATKSGASISFRQIHEPSGKPIRYEKVVPGVGPVDRDDILKGYQIEKNRYILLDDDEIEAVKVESKRTLDLVQFVEADEIDVLYYEKPYFVVPADELAEEAYVVLRDALRKSRKVGLGQLSVRGREHLASLKPCGRGMVLELLRYADEVHRAEGYFRSIGDAKPDKELLSLATELIEKKTAPFKATEFHDRYVEGLKRVIDRKAKAKGKRVIEEEAAPAAAGGSNVIDLMAALKQSVAKGGETEPGKKRSTAKGSSSGRKTGQAGRKRA
ncbi:non-homologous end joining protein Ku [Novosphingobium endophyticum]|uniref:Non-homologous end joining protein Ku n=1 Tax=Novosphingobium endophyticum TaxID=1955250 RepID=A0A916TST7_9SPHN|nr:Ku protein [Novosphingobium endophyticum]GGC00123.1 non-homologous end joining protein Ku [Novosphingobium endophyticum]